MTVRSVSCTRCRTAIPYDFYDGAFHMCPACEASIAMYPFPALTRQRDVQVAEPLVDGQSSCFYHPHKKAVVPCESCGRFLCALCDIEMSGVHRCPACLEAGKRKQQLVTLETQHIRYDRIALALTTIVIPMWPITLITAPAALFLVIRFWNRRSKTLPRWPLGYLLAGLLALAEIGGWIFLLYLFTHNAGRSHRT
jgi:hypothetical protein